MKKVLAVLAVVLMFSVSAFAGPVTVTKEMSLAGYPGVLNPGSLTGANVFITDVALLANTALFEYMGDAFGLIALKSDFGTIGLSISPLPYVGLSDISVDTPNNVLGLQWVGASNIGVGLLYGIDNESWENKDVTGNAQNGDVEGSMQQFIGVKLGAALAGMDLGLNVGLSNYGETNKDLDNTTEAQEWKEIYDDSKITANLSARLPLDKTIKVVAGLNFATGQEKYTYVQDTDNNGTNEADYDEIYTNMTLGGSLQIGKDIKATDTLTVKMAAGVNVSTDSQALYKDVDRIADTTIYNSTSWSDLTVRVPLNFAIEGKLNDTWSINAGTNAQLVYMNMYGDKVNPDTTASKFDDEEIEGDFTIDPNLNFAIGVTGKIGDLTLDLYMNPMIIMSGPYLLTGNSIGWLNSGVALSYSWAAK